MIASFLLFAVLAVAVFPLDLIAGLVVPLDRIVVLLRGVPLSLDFTMPLRAISTSDPCLDLLI